MLLIERKLIVQECDNQEQRVDLYKYQNHSGITINHICKLIKEKKVAFEDDMPNMKTDMNHNLLTKKLKSASIWNTLIKQWNLLPQLLNTYEIINFKKVQYFRKGIFCKKDQNMFDNKVVMH